LLEQVMPNVYKIEIPLPGNPLKALNSYLIKGRGRNLLIDTGMNREECRRAMYAGLRELGVDLRETDFFITHMHADHSGLVAELAAETSSVYCSGPDAAVINASEGWEEMVVFARRCGFPEVSLRDAIKKHPGYKYSSRGRIAFTIVNEGDTISIGDYTFRCVSTPGHTAGHMCLYEPGCKVLVAGDHILGNITPNISLWSDDRNPLDEYLHSLDKVAGLDVRLVLPGHRDLLEDCGKRIDELRRHHRARAEEVVSILAGGRQNAYQVAAQMSWDLTYDSWDQFPVAQKWFATGEAIAHLKYLEGKRVVRRETVDGQIVFALN